MLGLVRKDQVVCLKFHPQVHLPKMYQELAANLLRINRMINKYRQKMSLILEQGSKI